MRKYERAALSPTREQRAEILCAYADGQSIYSIARRLGISRPCVERCVDKALAGGVENRLRDLPRSGRNPSMTLEAKVWVVELACAKPTDHGYPGETWTYSLLARHVHEHAEEAGHPCLKRASKSVIHRILKEHPIHPHKVRQYVQRRDPDFEEKGARVLVCHKEVENCLNSRKREGRSK